MNLNLKTILAPMLLLSAISATHAQTLKLGDQAPALTVAKWVKGQPVEKLDSGKVNVVEFWATWCGPCKTSIPHLTDLQKKYGDRVNFIGVSVWENGNTWDPNTHTKVAKFVEDMGEKMEYTIAADGEDASMAKNWMAAAGQRGIPAAFIVGGDGRILWIGHPMGDLDRVLGEVLANKYDLNAEIAKQEKAAAAQREFEAKMKPYSDAMKAKNYSLAVTELDKVMASDAKLANMLAMNRFNVLLKADEPKAYAYAKQLSETVYKDVPGALNQLAWTIVDDKTKLSSPDYVVAVTIAQRAVDLTKSEDPMLLDTLAYALFKNGDVEKAIATQEKAVAIVDRAGSDVNADLKKELKDRLATFKAKKG